MSQKRKELDRWLRQNFPTGTQINAEHPGGGGTEEATITSFTTDDMSSNLANGVMVQFRDGTFIEIPAGRLPR